MRTFITAIAAGLVVAVSLGITATSATAQTDRMTSPTIAVLNTQAVMQQSKVVKSIQKQMKERRASYQKKLSKKEKEIRAANQDLQKQKSILSAKAYQNKKKKLEERIQRIRGNVEKRKKQMQKLYNKAMRRVEKRLVKVVSQIAKEKNIDAVVNKSAVVIVRTEMEITDLALKRLNEKMQSLDLDKVAQKE